MTTKRKWKLYLVHHTHTDIGYTDRQEKIERQHNQFIRQAVKLGQEKDGFKWVCEAFWAVEKYLSQATAEQKQAFEAAVKAGHIEITANYLNMTELPDYELVAPFVKRAADYGQHLGVPVTSAMTADVNGYRLDYARALLENGIENLFFSVHTHHGMFPARRKQHPFWWEVEPGQRLLVWNSEHYMMGNDLGLVPNAIQSYIINDEFHPPFSAADEEHIRFTRLSRYLGRLEDEGYPFDFIPITLAGIVTDNAAPNGAIIDLIQGWNSRHGQWAELEMTTLAAFFSRVRSEALDIPVYSGEWPDWWSDGFVSTPEATRLFRQGQRNLKLAALLEGEASAHKELRKQARYHLMMYAEHTWGHSASVTEPFNQLSNAMLARKQAYAAEGARLSCILLDDLYERMGEAELYPSRPLKFKIINPYTDEVEDFGQLFVDSWETGLLDNGFKVVDTGSGEELKHQYIRVSRGQIVMVPLRLKANEHRIVEIHPAHRTEPKTTSSFALSGCDRIVDIRPLTGDTALRQSSIVLTENSIETSQMRIEWKQGEGIVSWMNKEEGQELIRRDAEHTAFAPVYEITPSPSPEALAETRRLMGRNRKGMNVRRFVGRLICAKPLIQGPVLTSVELFYEVEGMKIYSVVLTAYADMRRVDVSLRIQKDCVWDAENVYVSLPFEASGSESEIWLDKGIRPMRPWKDQILGTGTDFYTVRHGVVVTDKRQSVIIAMPDTPLVQVGSLQYEERLLSGHPDLNARRQNLYTWLMSNYWETNFKASVEGFYEFKYTVAWGSEWARLDHALSKCATLGTGFVSFRTDVGHTNGSAQ